MEAKPQSILQLFQLGGSIQYVLPHFQRAYAWDKSHWSTLWEDMLEIYSSDWTKSVPEHFMGALVVIQEGESIGTLIRFTVVDGQQRLTTISLILCALKEVLEPTNKLRIDVESLLFNPKENGELFYKLVPTLKYNDRQAYFEILDGDYSVRKDSSIATAFQYFKDRLSKIERDIDPEKFFKCIVECMQVVFITLKRDEKPYKIFESLNAKGKALTQADLVRNYVAMKLPVERQEEVFNQNWADIDNRLRERGRKKELSAFLRHYLAKVNFTLPNEKQVYARFRDYMEQHFQDDDLFIAELERLRKAAVFYEKLLRPDSENSERIREQIRRLNTIIESVSYPFLLHLYELKDSSRISELEYLQALEIVENYGVRRFLADAPTSYHNKMFPTLVRDIEVTELVPSLTNLVRMKNYATNYSIRENLKRMNRLGQTSRKKFILVLLTIDQHLWKDAGGHSVLDGDATIEHIMPQSLSHEWKEHIGENWNEVHVDFLDNIGNVTLVDQKWNIDLSNGQYVDKKMKLKAHALRINSDYFSRDIPVWNRGSIISRAAWLTDLCIEIWNPLGSFAPPLEIRDSIPTLLKIDGKQYAVDSWEDVLIKTVETIIYHYCDAEMLTKRFNQDLSRISTGFARHHKLENGLYLNTMKSDSAVFSFCKKFALAAGIPERDWHVDFE